MDSDITSDEAFERLHHLAKRVAYLEDARLLLNWDQQVTMPEEAGLGRAKQFSAISASKHDIRTSDEVASLLEFLEEEDLSADRRAIVREIRREHDREQAVPEDHVEKLSEVQSNAFDRWQVAKADDDFDQFKASLEKHSDLQRERASYIDPDRNSYEVLFEDGEPYLGVDRIEEIFDDLLHSLVPLIEDIRSSEANLATDIFQGEFDSDRQMELCTEILDYLEYDWSRGRIDTAPHPFDGLTQFDARITTRFDESNLASGLLSAIHEFGHATYNLGLSDDHYGSPLGRARSHGIHESQSRFWENHVGRSKAFWEAILPIVKNHFPQLEGVNTAEAYEAVNQVYDNNVIRVEADELTYHMHIIIRHEVERELLDGDLAVEQVPERWNNKYDSYLGIQPDSDAEGCLQDVHWTTAFGMFPNYTIGSVLAAQLAATMEEDIGSLEIIIRENDVGVIHEWLTEHVHSHGQRYPTDVLIERATGEPLSAQYLIEYIKEKYTNLYGL